MRDIQKEEEPAKVIGMSRQAGDTHNRDKWRWAEPTVWTERMLTALEEGVKGGKWFALMDKVYDHYKWPNAYFSRLGLFTLTAAHEQARQSR